jgi:nitrogen fixation NifU-like protein
MYNETVLRHYNNPRNVGEISCADGIGIYMSDFCGDITKFWIKIEDNKIVDVKYRTQGCAAAIACGSILTELAKNKTIDQVLEITKDDIVSALNGLPEQKIHCSVLADDALKEAIHNYLSKHGLPVPKEMVERHEKIMPLLREMKQKGYILI